MTEYNPETLKENLKTLIEQKRKGEALRMLKDIVINKKLAEEELYDLIGGVIQIDQSYFMDKLYPKMYKNIKNHFNSNQLYEMEQYILEKDSLQDTINKFEKAFW